MNVRCAFAAILAFAAATASPAEPGSCLTDTEKAAIRARNPHDGAVAEKQLSQYCDKVGLQPTSRGTPSLTEVLKLALAEKRPGGDRLKPAAPAGFPTGPVLPRNGVITIDTGAVEAEGIRSLDVTGPEVQIHLRPPPAGPVRIAASQVRAAAEYSWKLVTARQTYSGSFTIPDAETAKRVGARLEVLKGLSDNPITLLALEAAIYDDEEIYASRDQVAALLRRELDKP